MRLIVLTSQHDGLKLYVNPSHIMIISESERFGDEAATIVKFSNGDSYVKVLESAESIARMIEGERNE